MVAITDELHATIIIDAIGRHLAGNILLADCLQLKPRLAGD